MHTPDGFLTGWICIVLLVLSAIPVALAFKGMQRAFTRTFAAKIATVAAIIFMAQMLNFPILDGTSGHLIGAAFALILLGVDGAVIAMASVLLVQAVIFGDGGMLSIGANIFNMGVVGVYSADFVCRIMVNMNRTVRIFIASLASVIAASFFCAIELGLSGTFALATSVTAMVPIHAIIGVGEGMITVALASLLAERVNSRNFLFNHALGIAGFAFLAFAFLLPFASSEPDGLERIAINFGFFENAVSLYSVPAWDYSVPAFAAISYLATLGAALAGVVSVFGLVMVALNSKAGICHEKTE